MLNIKNQFTRAFTLIEMSIVLLIISLIAGSVTVGNFLVNQARIRAVISEVRDYKTAVNSFIIRFSALPGDLTNASSFWSTVSSTCTNASSPSGCNGNGNGYIDYAASPIGQGAETLRAWQHLSLAGLVNGNYTGVTTVASQYDIGINVPASKFSPAGYYLSTEAWASYSSLIKLYISLGNFVSGAPNSAVSLIPTDLYDIDIKIDDGNGKAGNVLGMPTSTCVNSSTGAYIIATITPTCLAGFVVQ